jgi:MinD-like ATPase involved in chromosome partitioning or flagellar assembly
VAVPGAANLHHARKHKLIRQIKKLPCDVAVIDCGAGIHHNTVDLFTAADVQLLVASPQLVSLQNAYGFLKASVYRMLRQRAQELDKLELMESASDKSEVETTTRLLTAIRQRDPALADELTMTLANASCVLLGNQLSGPNEINALHALSRMINDFLRLRVPVLGGLQRRDRIHAAVSRRKPFALDSSDPEARLLLQVAQRLLTEHSVTRTGQRGAEQTRDFPVEGAARVPIHESGIEYRGEAGTGQTNADAPPPPARLRTS